LCHVNINIVWCLYDSWGVITCYFGIITLWLRLGVGDKLSMCWIVKYLCIEFCMHWIVSYELYNHTTVRPFKGDKLMCDEYCDGIHRGNLTSWIVLKYNELKSFWKQLSSCVYCIVQTPVTHIW